MKQNKTRHACVNSYAMVIHIQIFVWPCVFSSLGIYVGVELLDHMITLTFWGTAKLFSKGAVPFYGPISNALRIPISPYPHQYLLLSVFFIIVMLGGVKWYLILVLYYISLMVNWAFFICISSLEECVYSNPLPIFNWVVFLLLSCKLFIYSGY